MFLTYPASLSLPSILKMSTPASSSSPSEREPVHVAQGKVVRGGGDFVSAGVEQPVFHAARLGAFAPVAAAPAYRKAQLAASAVRNAERAVHKALQARRWFEGG